jgi:ATP-dependent helicase/nuclease subunit B
VDDGAAEPSRFVEQLAWEEERAGRPPTMQRVRYGVSLSSRPPVPIAKSPEVLEWLARIPLSPSGLDDWLACPLSFYYRRVLGLEERQEVTGDIEPLDIGSFVHRVLAEYLTPLRGTPLEPGALDPAVAARLVAARFPQAFGAADAGRARLLERQLARRLSDFVARWLAPLAGRERLVVLEVERRVTREAGGLPLTGTIDAVLERDGVPCILDFKTGYDDRRYRPRLGALDIGDRSSWLEGVRSVQLPCYLLLYGAETGREPPSMDARFLLLGKSAMDDRIEVPLFTDREEAAAEWPRVAEVVRRLAAEVLDPAVPFSPTAEPELRCPRCPYRTACCGPEPEV